MLSFLSIKIFRNIWFLCLFVCLSVYSINVKMVLLVEPIRHNIFVVTHMTPGKVDSGPSNLKNIKNMSTFFLFLKCSNLSKKILEHLGTILMEKQFKAISVKRKGENPYNVFSKTEFSSYYFNPNRL